jgi:4-aminobutyrate aminotransferase-like enzyme
VTLAGGIRRIALPGPEAKRILAMEAVSLSPAQTRKTGLVWASASGATIMDVDGNEFVDFGSGILVTNIGHAHPRVTAAVVEAAARSLTFYNYPHAGRAALAARLSALFPGELTRAVFFSGGSEAVDAAVRMARLYTGRTEVLGFEGAFHGRTYAPMSVGGIASVRKAYGPVVPGTVHAPYPSRTRDADRDWRAPIEASVASLPGKSIAAIFAEPYLGAGGVVIPPGDFLPYLRELCDRLGALLVIDEVQSGYGRTGPMFAVEHAGVRPDIVVLGKGMANGFPVAALVTTETVGGFLPEERFSSTYGANPVACAAALAVLDVFETENVLRRGRELADALAVVLADWRRDLVRVGEIRQLGMAIGVDLVGPDGLSPDPALARRLVDVALTYGVAINLPIGTEKNTIRIGPPLTTPIDQARDGMDCLRAALLEATR